MKLEKYRKFDFVESTLNTPHPFAKYKKITFLGTDNSKIELDLVIPNSKVKGVIVDFPEFKVKNKDYLNLTKSPLLSSNLFLLFSFRSLLDNSLIPK